ncbi:MAG: ATP-binding protein [Pseudomonadota bacterium]
MSDLRPKLSEILGRKKTRDVLIPTNFGTGSKKQAIDIARRHSRSVAANDGAPEVTGFSRQAANQDFSHNPQDFGTMTWDSLRNEVTLDPVLCEIAGVSSPIIGGRLKDFLELVDQASRSQLTQGLRESLSTGKDLYVECRIGQNPGDAREVRVLGKTLEDHSGRPTRIVCAVQPKTSPPAAPPVREQTPLAKAAHDLRTPINAISGYAQLMRADPLTDRQRDCLERVETSCETMLSTISSELDSPTTETRRESPGISLRSLISDVGEMFAAMTPARAVTLEWHVEGDDAVINIDQVKLRRILINLTENALKHTEQGHVTITAAVAKEHLKICVTDSGCGIPKEVLSRIFEPFFRFEQVGGPVGAGLGLAICRDLVHQLRGTVEVDSTPGEGSCFTVEVPVEQVKESGLPLETLEDLTSAQVALVGDNSFHNRCIAEALTARGMRVGHGSSAADGGDSDLVVVDVSGQSGDAAKVSRMRSANPDTALIAVCDALPGGEADDLLTAGADTLLIKPFLERELMATVESALSRTTLRSGVTSSDHPRASASGGSRDLMDRLDRIDVALAGDPEQSADNDEPLPEGDARREQQD